MPIIYALCCPVTNSIRYIGKTNRTLAWRLSSHIIKARSGHTRNHCANWIRSLLKADSVPVVVPLLRIDAETVWQDIERFLIASGRFLALPLTNATSGGEGVRDLDDESMTKRVTAMMVTRRIPEVAARMAAAIKAGHARTGVRERHSASIRAAWANPKVYERYIAGMREPKALKRRSMATKERFADESARKKHGVLVRVAVSTPEARQRQSERSIAIHARPGHTEKVALAIKAAHARPEVKANQRAAAKEVSSRPEVIAARAAGLRAARADQSKALSWNAAISAGKKAAFADKPYVRTAATTEATKAKMKTAAAKREAVPEMREIRRLAARAQWADPVIRAQRINSRARTMMMKGAG